jgi:hypothetical protein
MTTNKNLFIHAMKINNIKKNRLCCTQPAPQPPQRFHLQRLRMVLPRRFRLLTALTAATMFSSTASANIKLVIAKVGSDVIASYSGSLDTTGMGFGNVSTATSDRMSSSAPRFYALGAEDQMASVVFFGDQTWLVAPTAFGTGDNFEATTADIPSGNTFFFEPGAIRLAQSYVSESPLSGSLTFENTSLADMGINPGIGIMTATFGSGDTLTVDAVPEPSTYAALLGLMALTFAAARRRRK